MAIFYLDPEAGNDSNDGTTFANRWKTTTNGATAARIAPGDTIRIIASPDPTSLGQAAQWTNGPLQATKSITSSTNATPIVMGVPAHGLVTGDTVINSGHATNTNANGVWTVGTYTADTYQILNPDGSNSVGNGVGSGGTMRKFTNGAVTLTTEVTKNIALCGNLKTNWTASANVTCANYTSDHKEGYSCQQIQVGDSFTTGKAAYYATGTIDLSGYQQVSFWVKQTSGTIGAAGACYIGLCTDTAGAAVVHQAPIPALGGTNRWMPVTVDLGGALNSSIKSVALWVVTDNGAQTFLIDNIIACKASSSADSLTLTSLIGKNTGTEGWYGIQSINGTRVVLEQQTNTIPGSSPGRGYWGATESVTTYKRETIKTTPAASSSTAVNQIMDYGTAGNLITYSGGWNRTNMSTQTGQTWLDGQNGNGYGIKDNSSNCSYIYLDKLFGVRYNYFLEMEASTTNYITIGSIGVANISQYGIALGSGQSVGLSIDTITQAHNCGIVGAYMYGVGSTATNAYANNCSSNGLYLQGISGSITNAYSTCNSGSSGIALAGVASKAGNVYAYGNQSYGVNFSVYNTKVVKGSTGLNGSGGIYPGALVSYLTDVVVNDSVEVSIPPSYGDYVVYSQRHDDTDDNHWQFHEGGTVNYQTTVKDGDSLGAWKISITDAKRGPYYPLKFRLDGPNFDAGTAVTCTIRLRRSNTNLHMAFILPGGTVHGVTSDVLTEMTAAPDTWETVTITFTPDRRGGCDLFVYAWTTDGGTTYTGYVANLTAVQA
jgi:hypothetical protein